MSEPTPAPAPEPSPTPAPTPAPAPERAANGQFLTKEASDHWRSTVSEYVSSLSQDDPDREGFSKFAERAASPLDVLRSNYDLRKANGSMVRVPKEDSKPEQIAAFRKAIGAPENAEGYAFKDKEGEQPSDADKALRASVAGVLNKYHAPAAMAVELQGIVETAAEAVHAEEERVAVKFREDSEAALRKEMGADFDSFVEGAKRIRDAIGNDDLKELLNTPVNGKLLGDHPALIRLFGVWGKRSGEMEHLGALTATESKSINEQIDEFYRQNPPGSEGYRSKQRELQALFAKLDGNQPIVGSQGRAA